MKTTITLNGLKFAIRPTNKTSQFPYTLVWLLSSGIEREIADIRSPEFDPHTIELLQRWLSM